MSLILDALKKADAERSLGRAPGLQAQPVAWSEGDEETTSARPRWLWPVLAAAALLAMAAAGAWWWQGRTPPAVVAREIPTAATQAAAPSPAAVIAAAPPSLPAPAPPAPAPSATAAATAIVAPPPIRPIVPPTTPAAQAPSRPPAAPPERPRLPATSSPSDPAKPAASTSAASPVLSMEALPEGLRRNLPPLTIGGSIYADRPADRILIVNGQPLKEGDPVDGRVTLESIGRQTATWRLGDQRFTTRY